MKPFIIVAIALITTNLGPGVVSNAADGHLMARAALKNSSGGTVGSARLRETPNGLWLRVDLRGLPAGTHALHIHETGRCEPPTFESAGGHFAPGQSQHGFLDAGGPHAGDLPNIHMPGEGQLSIELFVHQVVLTLGGQSLLDADGAALVVHAGEDDYSSEPAGAAGDRIACGVIMQ
jgi:Cu-Zn family superoxide dismutase